ncbi:zinc-binding dehydrogenase [Mucilaginibacter corticis]|uniref:Zinc-binding dehydrogenase n=1 Tax=Mucilaginibacter corticis TaxID=2597670 RepID=A0A556M9D6_9SPHI|nr:zinc-binding dehydrogenase [Mucilaginibacter corticis]TSJ36513.1 zinc-binding dehydrogenase [Mucilaginibacter corticis]
MKAITMTGKGQVALTEVPKPEQVSAGHLLIKMSAMGINPGDKFLISGNAPAGMFTQSRYDIAGVSGAGQVTAIGEGVPEKYLGKLVTVYRSLSDGNISGTWSEYAHLPYLQCAILPDDADPADHAGSLVNIITAYAAMQQFLKVGHQGVIITAGNSDTGKAMLGFALEAKLPVLSIVRNESSKAELEKLGAKHILVQGTEQFAQELMTIATALKTTAVFDGVGGELLSQLIPVLPAGATVYAYGFLGGPAPVSFHTGMLTKGITIKGFSNFKTATVQDPQQLAQALEAISQVIHLSFFKFNAGKQFSLEEIEAALSYTAADGSKAVLVIG